MAIQPRIQFYEATDIGLDSDSDGTIDSLDDDMDNDGFTNDVDAFVFDSGEWSDADADGVGDNSDWMPNDASEQYDSDGDGVGDNADFFPFDPNLSEAVELATLIITDPELATCIAEQTVGLTYTHELTWLDCSDRDIYSINELDQLPFLDGLIINNMVNVTDWSVVSRLPNLTWFDAPGSHFNDGDVGYLEWHNSLRYIVLNNTDITDVSGFANIPGLEQLSISDESTYDLWPLTGIQSLTSIHVDRHQVNDMNTLLNMPSLNALTMNGSLNQNDINTISQLWNLNSLAIGWGNGMGNDQFNHLIWSLQNLTYLHYAGTELNDISEVPNALPNLDTLSIHYTAVSDLSPLIGMSSLTNVEIDQSPITDANQIQQLQDAGVAVHGSPIGVTLIADLVFADAELLACVSEHTAGMTFISELRQLDCNWRVTPITDYSGLEQLSYVTDLFIQGDNQVDLWSLTGLGFLNNLDVQRHQIQDFNALQAMSKLSHVTVMGTLTWEDVDLLAQMKDLTSLSVGWGAGLGDNEFNHLIWNLPNLRGLHFAGTQITNVNNLPNALPQLEWLVIQNTNVTDLSPLFGMENLGYIDIENTPIIDPNQVQQLINDGKDVQGTPMPVAMLNELTFNDAELNQCIIDGSSGLTYTTDFTWLDCTGYDISDINDLDQLPFLQGLIINDMVNITDWSVVSRLPQLTWFDAPGSHFNDGDVGYLEWHNSLRYIVLNNTDITDVSGFANIPGLEQLSISDESTYDLWPLTGIQSLTSIHVDRHQVNDMNTLLNMPSLNALTMNGSLNQNDINTISQLWNLNSLAIGWGNGMGNDQFNHLIWSLPNLTYLHYAGTELNDISEVPNALPNLDTLSIHYTAVSDLSPLIGMSSLTNVEIDQSPIIDANQIQQLQDAGVAVHGSPIGVTLIADLVFADAELLACVSEHTAGMTYVSELTQLDCSWRATPIVDYSGIEQLTYLNSLTLDGDNSVDLWSLTGLQFLDRLSVQSHQVQDMYALHSFANLSQLWVLGSMTQEFIDVITQMPYLVDLGLGWGSGLGNNEFSQIIWSLPNLTSLHYAGTQLSDISEVPNALPDISGLAIHNNQISDLSALYGLPNLGYLDINENPIVDPNQITDLINAGVNVQGTPVAVATIASLSFNDPELTACVAEHTGGLTYVTELTGLYCSWRGIKITDLTGIEQLAYLNEVHLNGEDQITDFSPLTAISNLQRFEADSSGFNDADLGALSGMPNIQHINVSWANVTDISVLAGTSSLRSLVISGDDTRVYDLSQLTGLPNLVSLHLNANNAQDIWEIPNLPYLNDLGLLGNINKNEMNLLTNIGHIEYLSVGWGNGIGTNEMNSIMWAMPNLKSLHVSGSEVDDISQVPNALPNLESLMIGDTAVTDVSMLVGMSNLGWLDINNAPIIDTSVVQTLIDEGKGIGGTSATVGLLADLVFIDSELQACVDEHAAGLTYITELKNLDCNWRATEISDISDVNQLTYLTDLYVEGSNIMSIDALHSMQFLNTLFIQESQVVDMWSIGGIPKLSRLAAYGAADQNDINAIASMNYLVELNLGSAGVLGDTEFNQLVYALPNLVNLNFGGSLLTTIADVPVALPNLEVLSIWGTSVSDLSPLVGMSALNYLDIDGAPIIDNGEIQTLTDAGVTVAGTPSI
ncbi:hypothetical protein AADZ86_18975 [Colwelliaceae bacterium BS250]